VRRSALVIATVVLSGACAGSARGPGPAAAPPAAPPSSTPAAATAPSAPASASAAPPGVAAALVAAHNRERARHCARALTWSPALARIAQAWADHLGHAGCRLEHSRNRYGENLAAGSAGGLGPGDVVSMWSGEASGYDFRRPGFSMSTGHFTQVVWRDTARVGCGVATCNGLDIWVCNYDPPGNVEGGYRDNVQPVGCM
jgi:pathogenesis-related protein 1